MKQMQRGSSTIEARRERERRAEEKAGLITIKPIKTEGESSSGGGKPDGNAQSGKKGFKSAFGTNEQQAPKPKQSGGFKKAFTDSSESKTSPFGGGDLGQEALADDNLESETDDDEGYAIYDPARPTL
ncbi:hypothetical protein ABW19_dt0203576 [Dactylella cylindrospora]|nr:hypothetical protein ABW19_dt0203576 [Dactylella cylindrospora]